MDNEKRPAFNFCDFMRSWNKETPMYEVYQIRSGSQSAECKFCGLNMIERLGLHLDGCDYDVVYAALLDQFEGTSTLEEIYVELNKKDALAQVKTLAHRKMSKWVMESGYAYVDFERFMTKNGDRITPDVTAYLSDGTHPTAQIHSLISKQLLSIVQ